MNEPGVPNVIEDLDRLQPNQTVEAENNEEFTNAVAALEPDEVRVVILGKPRHGYAWEPLAVYWSGTPEFKDTEDGPRLDVPMPTQEELLAYARKHRVRFTKGAVQTPVHAKTVGG